MLGVDLTAPDHTTLSRRRQHLALALRRARPGTSLPLIVDSTGLSIVGAGEWAAATHGGRGRRGWRKLHLGVDGSRVIVACALTEPTADDAMYGDQSGRRGGWTPHQSDGGSGLRHARVLWCCRCARGEGRGAADQDRVVVSTGRPIRCPRSDDQEGEGARTATVEEGVWLTISQRAWRMRSSGTRRSSATVFGHAVHRGNGVRPCSRVTF